MAETGPHRKSFTGSLGAPALVGVAYALARTIPPGAASGGPTLSLQGPFLLAVLSGALIALGCRPVLSRVPWSRGAAVGLGLALLLGVGPAADWALARGVGWAGLAVAQYDPPGWAATEILGAVAAAGLMGLLFRYRGGAIGAASIWARLGLRSRWRWCGRVALLAGGAVALWLVLGWADSMLVAGAGGRAAPLVNANPWLRLAAALTPYPGAGSNGALPPAAGAGWGLATALLGLTWLRALAMILPLALLALAIRGAWWQLTFVFGVLLFVVGDFAPLMLDQPYTSTQWLLQRTALGLARAAALGGAAAWALGLPRLSGGGGDPGPSK
ncbi:MAG: hypothetical protein V3S29_07285 [bacterium]